MQYILRLLDEMRCSEEATKACVPYEPGTWMVPYCTYQNGFTRCLLRTIIATACPPFPLAVVGFSFPKFTWVFIVYLGTYLSTLKKQQLLSLAHFSLYGGPQRKTWWAGDETGC